MGGVLEIRTFYAPVKNVKKLVKFSAIYRAGRYKGGVLGREVFEVLLRAESFYSAFMK
jgi:hypothetical protein